MEWIRKNKALLIIVAAAIIIWTFLYFMNKKNKAAKAATVQIVPALPPTVNTTANKIRADLSDCENNAKAIRLIPGTPHPCTKLREQVAALNANAATPTMMNM